MTGAGTGGPLGAGQEDPRPAAGARWAGHSRRRFLIGLGLGLAGTTALGSTILAGTPPATTPVAFGADWLFGPFVPGCTEADFDDDGLARVTVPHCVSALSWHGWEPSSWENLWVYRQTFDAPAALRAGRVFVTFDGILSAATVYLNGRQVGAYVGGYLPLTCELTGLLTSTGNVLAVAVDGRWRQDAPPDVPRFPKPSAIDFYQPGGMYRPARLYGTPRTFLADVFAEPVDVLTDNRSVALHCTVNAAEPTTEPVRLTATLRQGGPVLATATTELTGLTKGENTATVNLTGLAAVRLWELDDPALCEITVTLRVGDRDVHTHPVRTGLREARFTVDGFLLNGKPTKLFGLNRHQWYPYVGGAMPDRVQRRDAQILKSDLNCNMVRCSHYPQSTAFLDACDELGLLVWEELPGWDYVGDDAWQARALQDVHDMVIRDRNHPSIIVWGTRVNESIGQPALYGRTDRLAERLDPTRARTGAVTGNRGYNQRPYPHDGPATVFSFNDYSRPAPPGTPPTLRPPKPGVPYFVSEAIGSLVGSAHYRRTDTVAVQREQGVLHAWVHERAAADPRYCGLLGWCGFDYPSGWYHSVDGMKYTGVADFFRIPKLGAGFYRSQANPATGAVLEPAFYWDFGPGSPAAGPGRQALIWSNCDRLAVTLVGQRPVTVKPARKSFPHLDHPPFLVDLTVHTDQPPPELVIDGFVGNRQVIRRRFSGDPTQDRLYCAADDPRLVADGQDATRVVLRVLDRYGAPRPYPSGQVSIALSGPGTLVGDTQLDLAAAGGAAAVWLRSVRGQRGVVTLFAAHDNLGTESAMITTV